MTRSRLQAVALLHFCLPYPRNRRAAPRRPSETPALRIVLEAIAFFARYLQLQGRRQILSQISTAK
ncbi:MAG: hypothetical protein ACRD5L_00080, partial [Bryobacteraceae bacterium]